MNDSKFRPIFNLYIDDSGTRHPDHRHPTSPAGDWFGLGGFLIAAEDEDQVRRLHQEFCEKWNITTPLHSIKIRHRSHEFQWLESLTVTDRSRFFASLDELMIQIPAVLHGCIIDRPGYYNRYYEFYGRQSWKLCKTAFSVLCERAAKYAIKHDRRVRVFVEKTDKKEDNLLKEYFREMRGEGMPFAKDSSQIYGPLNSEELNFRLLDLIFKGKSSPLIQLADLYLYPICKGKYQPNYRTIKLLQENNKLIDLNLEDSEIDQIGIKYSCFDA